MRKLEWHGRAKDPAYNCWKKMRTRCKNPKDDHYKWYGERGIGVCERWDSFSAFLEDMGPRPSPRHTIGRIDNDLGYSPENCRWELPYEQTKNRAVVYKVPVGDKVLTGKEWAEHIGVCRPVALRHLRALGELVRPGYNGKAQK